MKISASAISLYRTCPRKFAYRYVHGLREPQHPSAALGEEVHAHAEAYVATGTPPPATRSGEILRAGLYLLPRPGEGKTESAFAFEREGVTFTGRIDWTDGRTVIDYKTTSNPRYAQTPESLVTDPQATLYLEATGAKIARWIYLPTKGQTPFVVERTAPPEMSPIVRTSKLMLRIIDEKVPASDLTPVADSCYAYGGCTHRERCGDLSLRELTSGGKMSNEELDARVARALEKHAVPHAPPPPPLDPEMARTIDAVMSEYAPVMARLAATPTPPPPPPPLPPPTLSDVEELTRGYVRARCVDPMDPINAPEAPPDTIVPPPPPPPERRDAVVVPTGVELDALDTSTLRQLAEERGYVVTPRASRKTLLALFWRDRVRVALADFQPDFAESLMKAFEAYDAGR